jgi:3-hydroxyacyl-CoA dehydrogenase/enoyl-CoA hydratase/3-hydroxybutyryl-CoA epimerase
MSATQNYQHWRLETDADHILWIYFDKQNAVVNTIDRAVMEEFSLIVEDLTHDTMHVGAIITSAKKSGFAAGADISQFTALQSIDQAASMLTLGQHIFNKLAAVKVPTVAMIDGFCLGGGLELALACRYRVVEESAKTRLGLPEVKLGIHPGWGGSVRLLQLIGNIAGLNMVLSGHTISGRAAAKLGLADAAVPKRQLAHAAKYYILQKPAAHQPFALLQKLSNKKLARQVIAYSLRKKLKQKINPMHYPAPFQVVDNWEKVGIVKSKEALAQEAKSCAKLFFSETSHNLVRVFFLQEQLKSLAKDSGWMPQHIHVVGAGTMGGDIAAWCALQGFTVTLQDLQPPLVAAALKRAYVLFQDKLKENYLIQAAMDRLIPDVAGEGIAKADIIIEAVVENLTVKQAIFKEIEVKAKPDAILATNTSSIPLDEINKVLAQPERLIGIHFFNPVAKMLLVEVVQGKHTSQEIMRRALSFIRSIDHLPLPVQSSPGFLVNRILMPYLLESMVLLNEGVPMAAIDKAMVNFGMPMGPITLADTVGLDVCLSVAQYLGDFYGIPVPPRLIELVQQGKLGKKTGEGFYKYDKRGKQIQTEHATYDQPLEKISKRLVMRMLNESFACLREGVVANADLLDAGMVFGTGFAPFRGGPMQYAKAEGIVPPP